MKRFLLPLYKNIFLLAFVLLMAGIVNVDGANRYSVATGTWNSTSVWSATSGGSSGVSVPVASDVVYIEGNRNVTITVAAACTTLNIASGSTLNVGASSLTVSGATNVSGTIAFTSTTGTETFTGLTTINSTGTWNNAINENINFQGGLTNNGTFTAGTGTYTFNTNNQTIAGTLTIPKLTVTGITLTNNGNLTVSTTLAGTGGITTNGTLISSGSITNSGAKLFNSGSTYKHAQNGGIIPTATWNATSNCTITGITSATSIAGLDQTFGNFTWNCPGQTSNFYMASNMTIAGDFTVSGTGTFDSNNHVLRMSNGTGYTITVNGNFTINTDATFKLNNGNGACTLNVDGDFNIAGGYFVIVTGNANSVVNVTGSVTISSGNLLLSEESTFGTLNVKGNFSHTGGTIAASASYGMIVFNGNTIQNYSSGGNITDDIRFTVNNNAYLQMASAGTTVTGGGSFTLANGGTLGITSPVGISTSGATGNIQVAGTRTYNNGANYTYNGTSAQVTGNGLTGANNLTINNSSGVALSTVTTVSGVVTLTSGILTSSSTNTLTVTNNSTGAITSGSTTRFINGPLIWQLATGSTYSFPIGKGTTYLPFGLTGITGSAPRIMAEAFTGSPGGSATSPLTSLGTTEYWQASVFSGTYTTGSVSLTRQSALGGLNAIGRSATQGGAYASLNGTVSGTSIINSDITGNTLGYFVMASKTNTITPSNISPATYCQGASVSIPYTITGTFTGNTFTAQLSNSTGGFGSPVTIGSITSNVAGTIAATIPAGATPGTGYRIRVVSSSPVITGTDNGSDLTINASPSAPTVGTITQPTCALATGSVVLSGLPASGIWTLTRNPGSVITTGTGTSTTISGLVAGSYTFYVSEGDNSGIYPGSGTGLTGNYFTNMTLNGTAALTQVDPTVGFNWGANAPANGISANNFSVRWTGMVQPGVSGNYTFTTRSDDGIRLFLNGTQIINNWTDHSATDNTSVTIPLAAGQKYPIVMEFYENGGEAVAQLSWTPPGATVAQIIPQSQLYPVVTTDCTSPSSGNVTITTQPTAPVTPSASVTIQPTCAVPTGTIGISAPTGGAYEYQLDAGTFQASATFTGVSVGNHTVKARLAASPTCISNASTTLTVNAVPTVPATPTASVTVQPTCTVSTGTMVISAPTGASYEYQLDAGTYQASATFTSVAVGNHTVKARLAASPTCISNASTALTVNAVPTVPAPPTVGTITQPICIVATGSVVLSGLPATGTWTLTRSPGGTITTGTGTSTTISGLSAGIYTYTVTNSVGCISTASANVVINTQPATPNITGTTTSSRCGSGTLILGATASGGTINWYTSLTGGISLGTGNTYTTPSISITTTYYVDVTNGVCTSSPRVAVMASVITQPFITASGGGTFCSGSTVNLASSGTNLTSQYWTGPNSFYSLDANPVLNSVTTAMTGTYTVTGSALSSVNLINNGDFELGNTGFTTEYFLAAQTSSGLNPESTYDVIVSPSSRHSNFCSCDDHTAGSGTLQMAINGASTEKVVWSQSVNINPNTAYQFTYWVQTIVVGNDASPSKLQLYVNGTNAGPVYTANATTGVWTQFVYNWTSDSGVTSATLDLKNENFASGGNDFALDDIVFQQACEATYNVTVTVDAVVTAGTIGTVQSICKGATPAQLTSTGAGTGSGAISYEWQTNASGSYVTIAGATASTYSPPALTSTTSYQRRTVSLSGGTTCYSPYTTPVTITVSLNMAPTAVAGAALSTCSNSGAINITAGSSAANYSTVAWTSSGTGIFINASSLTTATYTPSAADITAGSVTLILTATGNSPCGNAVSTKTLTITTLPAATISYSGAPFCISDGVVKTVTRTGTAGGTYSAPAGLTINTSTGSITPSTSTAGTYTVTYSLAAGGGCGIVTANTSVTITAVPTATISYVGTPFCSSVSSAQAVTLSGTGAYTAGTYTSTAGLSINASTGAITPSTSTAGTYTVTYTIPTSGGCASVPVTTSVTITTLLSATISYSGSPFCKSVAVAQAVTRTGTAVGTYSAPAGLTINTSTGAITPSTSTSGTYTVTYTLAAAGGCGIVTATTSVTVTAVPTATISYAGTPFCNSISSAQAVTLSGTGAYTGGTYSAAAGLSINASTGAIIPSTSTAGTYTVTYTIPLSGGCAAVPVTTTVTITTLPAATFSYTGSPYCQNASNPLPTFSGGGVAGTFTSTTGLVFVSAATGQVNLSASTAGTYTVTNTIVAYGGCAQVTATSPITINPNLPVSLSIAASSNSVCSGTSITFTATPSNGGTTPGYQWKVNGLNVGTNSASYIYIPLNNDLVTCELTSNVTCATGSPAISNTVTMIVNPTPSDPTAISVSPASIGLGALEPIVLSANGGGGVGTLRWYSGGCGSGSSIGNGSPLSIPHPLVTTTYYARWETATCNSNCLSTTVTINLNSLMYRSKTSGNWDVVSTWESSADNGSTWSNPTATPSNTDGSITIRNGHTVTVTTSVTVDEVTVNSGGQVTVNTGQIVTIANGASVTDFGVDGTIVNAGTIIPTGALSFNRESIYTHARDGGAIPVATWNATSTCDVTGMTGTNVTGLNQTFGNFIWDCLGQVGNKLATEGDMVVQGNFTLSSGTFSISNGPARNLTIGGSYIQTGGLFDFNNGISGTSLTKMYVAGNFTNTSNSDGNMTTSGAGRYNGEVIFNGPGVQNLSFANPKAPIWISFTINPSSSVSLLSNMELLGDQSNPQYYANLIVNGTLNVGQNLITDGTSQSNATFFTINAGATLITAHTEGIWLTGATGNIQLNGQRIYDTAANYVYNGSSAQVTGNGLVGANNLTIDNNTGVTMNRSVVVNGALDFNNGLLTTGVNTLTVSASGNIVNANSLKYVNGKLARIYSGIGSLDFPIGKGGNYRPLSLEYTALTGTSTVTAEQFETAITGSPPANTTLFADRYWDISESGGSAYTYSITLDGTGFSPDGEPVILKDPSPLTDYPAIPSGSNYTASGLTSISKLALASKCRPPTIDSQPASTTKCIGTSVTFSVTASGPGTISYQWRKGGVNIDLATNSSYTINPVTVGDAASYDVIITRSCGSITISDGAVLTVNPTPAVTAMTYTICSAGSFTVTPVNATNGIVPAGTTYSWSAPVVAGIMGTAAGSAAANISGTLTNTTNAAINVIYTVTPTSGSCTGSTFTVTVTVNPKPAVTNTPLTQTVCSGASSTLVTLTSNVSGATFAWTATATAGVSGFTASGTGTIPVQTISTTGTTQGTVTYAITPTASGCAGTVTNYTILVNPTPAVTAMTSTICSAGSFTATPVNSTNGIVPTGTTYSWSAPVVTGITGTLAGTNASNISGTLNNTTNAAINVIYTVTPLSGSCTGSTFTITVTVNPKPADTAMTSTICSAGSFTVTPVNNTNGIVPTGTTYSWSAPVVTGITGTAAGSAAANISGTLTNTTSAAIDVIYTVTPTSGSCVGSAFTVTVTVNPKPNIANKIATTCSGTAFTVLPVNGTDIVPTGTTYSWSAPSVAGITGTTAGSGSSNISGTLTNTTNAAIDVIYTVTPTSGSCDGNSFTVTVTVIPDGFWTGASDNDWNNPGNWACIQLPTLATNVTIASGKPNYPTLSSGGIGTANNLTIESGASVTVTGNTLQIAGNISNSGSFTASEGIIEMKGSVAQNIGANVFAGNAIMNLTVNNTTGVTLQGPLNVTGVVTALNGDLTSDGHLTLVSTSTQTALIDGAGAGNVLGNVNIQRYLLSAFGYKYVSSPFQAATVNEFAQEVDLSATFPRFYKYDENNSDPAHVTNFTSGWVKYNTPVNLLLSPLSGYAANLGANMAAPAITANMTGVVNNGNLQIALFNRHREFTKGFNLVGNPYPSPINWNAVGWTKTNIDNALYFFNASGDQYSGTYSSYAGGVSTDVGDNIIAAMQGFFVHVSTGDPLIDTQGTLGINNSVRVNTLNPVFKRAVVDNRTILRFTANIETQHAIDDAAVIYFDQTASLSFDHDLDALKMTNTDLLVPNIYSLTPESTQLSINGMPLPTDSLSSIPMGITTFTEGWITFKANDISQLPYDMHIYLIDAETGIQQDLKHLPDYRFYLKPGEYNSRFTLGFSLSELTEPTGAVGKIFTLSRSGVSLKVKANLGFNVRGTLLVTNLLGQRIMQRAVVGNETVEINPKVHTGVYIITLVSGKLKHSEKVIMKNDYE